MLRERPNHHESLKPLDQPPVAAHNLRTKIALSLILALASGCTKKQQTPPQAPNTTPVSQAEKLTPEERTWRLAHKVEDGIQAFEAQLAKLESQGLNPAVAKDLRQIITMVSNNQSFADRNFLVARSKRISKMPARGFLYRSREEFMAERKEQGYKDDRDDETPAMFMPRFTAVVVREDTDMEKPITLSLVLHEIGHAKDFHDLWSQGINARNGVVLESELKRYAYQVELLNAMLGGYFSRSISQGKSLLDNDCITESLQILGEEQTYFNRALINHFLRLAQLYYQGGGIQNGAVPYKFFRFILKLHEADKIFFINDKKQKIQLNPSNFHTYVQQGKGRKINALKTY